MPFLHGRNAVTGWAALRWLGGRWFDGTTASGDLAPVPVLLNSDHRPQPGFVFSEERGAVMEMLELDGLAITEPWRSVAFEMRYADHFRQAVVFLDMACYSDLVTVDEMEDYLALLNGWTGIPQARLAVTLGVENSWSPQETRLRLAWELDGGFPRPLCNVPIFDMSGHHLLTPDIFDPEAGVAGEYDGAMHLAGERRRKDRDREELMRDHGLEHFTVLAGDLGTSRALERMHAARARARFVPAGRRTWTIETPPWWTPTATVAQRRALNEEQRRRLLANRAA